MIHWAPTPELPPGHRLFVMFLVDTNVVSELIRPRPHLPLVRRLLSTDPAVLFASEITRYELRFGAAIHPKSGEVWDKVEREILPLPTGGGDTWWDAFKTMVGMESEWEACMCRTYNAFCKASAE